MLLPGSKEAQRVSAILWVVEGSRYSLFAFTLENICFFMAQTKENLKT
jgi:hypothetical protein